PGPRRRGTMNRRKFLRRTTAGLFASGLAGVAYSLFEARHCRVVRVDLPVPRLPAPFAGMTAAFLADIHHGPYVGLGYVRRVVDLWGDTQDLDAALGPATAEDASLLLSHNPDYVERIADRRVGLVLSGHTHGGQVVLPGIRPRWAPTRHGPKYLQGLVQGPAC